MKRDRGFTLLEVAIAISIFSILLVSVSKLMSNEIRMYNTAQKQMEIEQKTRSAMMQVLDEIRLNRYTYYHSTSGYDSGVYSNDPDYNPKVRCLINVNPNLQAIEDLSTLPNGTKVYYDSSRQELWYVKDDSGSKTKYLIANEISTFTILRVTDHLVRIFIASGDPSKDYYELVTWARLY
jgi:prepilin-type N-terminal cleavage/methylation domain-containing protein